MSHNYLAVGGSNNIGLPYPTRGAIIKSCKQTVANNNIFYYNHS